MNKAEQMTELILTSSLQHKQEGQRDALKHVRGSTGGTVHFCTSKCTHRTQPRYHLLSKFQKNLKAAVPVLPHASPFLSGGI